MSLNGFLKRLLGLISGRQSCCKLERSGRYQRNYHTWLSQQQFTPLLQAFYQAYHYKKGGMQRGYRVQLVKEQHRQGIILFFDPAISPKAFSYLFDYLKDRTLQLGYNLRNADRRKIAQQQYKQLTESYYLTPAPADVPGTQICNQRYGNVQIAYTLINYHPGYIRIMVNNYPDPHFSQPLPFDELLTLLLQPTEAA